MSFFDSDMVRAELAYIGELQEEVYGNAFKFPTMFCAVTVLVA